MVLERGVINWFTKEKEEPVLDDLPEKIALSIANRLLKKCKKDTYLKDVGEAVWTVLKDDEEIHSILLSTNTSRLPVCSLYHHLKNTSAFALLIAMDKGHDERSLHMLRIAALLHDAGKFFKAFTPSNHVKLTGKFFDLLWKQVKASLPWMEEKEWTEIKVLAMRHHWWGMNWSYNPVDPLHKILANADSIASIADRKYDLEVVDYRSLDLNAIRNGEEISIKIRNNDNIFPHHIRFNNSQDEPDEKEGCDFYSTDGIDEYCLKPREEREFTIKRVRRKGYKKQVQLFHDRLVEGGPTLYMRTSGYGLPEIKIVMALMDIPGIQRYINESKKLHSQRGASYLVEHGERYAEETVARTIGFGELVITCGGGKMLTLLPDRKDTIELIKSKIMAEFERNSMPEPAIALETFDIENIAYDFGGCVTALHKKLNSVRYVPVERKAIAPLRSDDICKHCSLRLGEETITTGKGKEKVCAVCRIKYEKGREVRGKMYDDIYPNSLKSLEQPKEISHIGDRIALMVFDGNRMGRIFQQTTTPAEYGFKSEFFDREMRKTLRSAFDDVFREHECLLSDKVKEEDGREKMYRNLDLLYFGGDDIVLFINAKGALHLAEILLEKVSKRFYCQKLKRPVVTLSGGVVMASSRFPIYFLLDRTQTLENKAKAHYRNNIESKPKGSFGFSSVTGSMPTSEHSMFLLNDDRENLDTLLKYIKALNRPVLRNARSFPRSLVSLIINTENTVKSKVNAVKFLFSSLDRKDIFKDALPYFENTDEYDVCLEVCRIISDYEMKRNFSIAIPMVWRK